MSASGNAWVRPSERVFRHVEAETGVGIKEMRSRSHSPRIVAARQQAMYLLYSEYRWQPTRIGRVLGYDRTTVMHAIGRHALAHGLEAPAQYIRRAFRAREGRAEA